MRKIILIILAVTIALGAGAILYLLGAVLGYLLPGFPADVYLKGLAGLPFSGIQNIYEFLETSSAKRAFAKTGLSPRIGVDEFYIHPILGFLLCLITWSGVLFFTGALMGVFVGIAESEIDPSKPKPFGSLVFSTAIPLRVIAAAYLGHWIGARSRRYGLAVVIGSIALGSGASFQLSILMMSKDQLNAILESRTVLAQFIGILPFIVNFIVSGALGFWYGRRQRPEYYLAFIMRMLPREIRQTIVEMAQEEAMRARPSAMQASS